MRWRLHFSFVVYLLQFLNFLNKMSLKFVIIGEVLHALKQNALDLLRILRGLRGSLSFGRRLLRVGWVVIIIDIYIQLNHYVHLQSERELTLLPLLPL